MRWRILWADSLSVFYHYILFRGKNQTKSTGLRRACAARPACRRSFWRSPSALAAGGCSITELSSLREFARPYEGEYRCEYAEYGGRICSLITARSCSRWKGRTLRCAPCPGAQGHLCVGRVPLRCGQGRPFPARRTVRKEYRKDVVLRSGKIFFSQMFAGKALVLPFNRYTYR